MVSKGAVRRRRTEPKGQIQRVTALSARKLQNFKSSPEIWEDWSIFKFGKLHALGADIGALKPLYSYLFLN